MGLRPPLVRVLASLIGVALVAMLLQSWVWSGGPVAISSPAPSADVSRQQAGGAGADDIDAQRVVDQVSRQVTASADGSLTAGDGTYRARFDAAGFTIDGLAVSLSGLRSGSTEIPLAIEAWRPEANTAVRTVAPGVTPDEI